MKRSLLTAIALATGSAAMLGNTAHAALVVSVTGDGTQTVTALTSSTSQTVDGVSFTASADPTNIITTAPEVTLNAFVPPSGEYVDGVTIGFNDLFDGPDQNTLLLTVLTGGGDTLVITIDEPGDINIPGFSQTNSLTSFTTNLNGSGDVSNAVVGVTAGQALDTFITISATGGDGITEFRYDWIQEGFDGANLVGLAFSTVPEPSSLALLGLGGLCMFKRRRRH